MTPDQARALFLDHCRPGGMEHYGESAAVAAIMEAAAMTENQRWLASNSDAITTACAGLQDDVARWALEDAA